MIELPEKFLERMKSQLGGEFGEFLQSYNLAPARAIRVNTLKTGRREFAELSPFKLEEVPWEKNGFYVNEEGLGKTLLHFAGLYYVQEPSAMCAVPGLEIKKGERVLDLCSAPGGKGTQIAQYLDGEGLAVLNEIDFRRAKILSSNVERLGVKNSIVTNSSPDKLAESFEAYFDKILVDAPCSGEGMFKKEPSAISEWSEDNVEMCAVRQKGILENAYKMLKAGGRMVYSTCTFSEAENEKQIENFVRNHDCKLIKSGRLYPHKVRGEGHFFAVLQKVGGDESDKKLLLSNVPKGEEKIYRQWESENLNIKFGNLYLSGGILSSLPFGALEYSGLMLRAGVRLGEFTNGRFEPSHSLAMCLKKGEAHGVEVDESTALNYLRGRTFECSETQKGFALVLYKGFPLGWCKMSQGVAKNKLPKGLRI